MGYNEVVPTQPSVRVENLPDYEVRLSDLELESLKNGKGLTIEFENNLVIRVVKR